MVKTAEIKIALLKYWVENRHMAAATEVSYGIGHFTVADVLAVDTNKMNIYEVEIKRSISDLKKEKKKRWKHENALAGKEDEKPNFFYFCLPEELLCKGKAFIETEYPKYGIMTVSENGDIVIIKRAKRLIDIKSIYMMAQCLKRVSVEALKYREMWVKYANMNEEVGYELSK
jgi:hypothetical protein